MTVDYVSWMDQLPTRLVNVHVDLLDGIPPIPSLVREFASVSGDAETHFILGGIQPRTCAMVIRSVRSDRYGGHRRIEPYAGLDFPLGAMSQILRAWDGGSEMPLPPLLPDINAVDNDDDVSLIDASMRSE